MLILNEFPAHDSLVVHLRDVWILRIETDSDFRLSDSLLKPLRVLLILRPYNEKALIPGNICPEFVTQYAAVCVWGKEPSRFEHLAGLYGSNRRGPVAALLPDSINAECLDSDHQPV
jgi:hypothetical protein